MTNFRRHLLWRPTPARRATAAYWLPFLSREDDVANDKVAALLRAKPAHWLNVLAGMPSTRWLAVLCPHAKTGQIICSGPTRRQVADLGRVICRLQDERWLQEKYPGPLNDRGQDRLEQQAFAIDRFLDQCVEQRDDAHLLFAVHVAGDSTWNIHSSPDWPVLEADRTLERAFHYFDVSPEPDGDEDYVC